MRRGGNLSEDEGLLTAIRASIREEQRFFSNAAKQERELWVVREFLRAMQIDFAESQLGAPRQYSDVDVYFRDACFQVKEVPEPDIRRGAELKAYRRLAESARRIEDLLRPAAARDIILSNAYLLILERASSNDYPPSVKASLDLLCYVTRTYCGLGSEKEIQKLVSTGWRSISCLYGTRALVLFAAEYAPSFLRAFSKSPGQQVIGSKLHSD